MARHAVLDLPRGVDAWPDAVDVTRELRQHANFPAGLRILVAGIEPHGSVVVASLGRRREFALAPRERDLPRAAGQAVAAIYRPETRTFGIDEEEDD